MAKDEKIFFIAFEQIIGHTNLKSKSLGRKVQSADVFLDKDHKQYDFPEPVSKTITSILAELLNTASVPAGSLAHHIDGFVTDHPELGTRIVEFDEEQHFNTFRQVTLNHLAGISDAKYIHYFLMCCSNVDYFNLMLRKHRLRTEVHTIPGDVISFVKLVEVNARPNNGYIAPKKPAFDFLGGRIGQRAYYDTLRDVAHLSKENSSLATPLRFTKYEFEEKAGQRFKNIGKSKLCSLIEERLLELI